METLIDTNFSKCESFPFKFFRTAEVNEVANLLVADTHVVEKLSLMFSSKDLDCFQFDNDFTEHEQVWSIDGGQSLSFVGYLDFRLWKGMFRKPSSISKLC